MTIKLLDYLDKVFTNFSLVVNDEVKVDAVKKKVRDMLLTSDITIKDGLAEITKSNKINDIDVFDFEIDKPRYTIFYYIYNTTDTGRVSVGHRLKTFNKLKEAEQEVKEIFYTKSDYPMLFKGFDLLVYRLVTKDKEGKSEPVCVKQEVSRDKELYIQYYDND